jgi:hypothetical protein
VKLVVTLLLLLAVSGRAYALETIEAQLSNAHPVVGEQVSLVVDIAVPGYFNGPTRFTLPSVDGVLLRQESQFAVNGSRRIDGETWATQRWTILLYPHRTGVVALPSLSFSVAYMDTANRSQRKNLSLPANLLLSYKPESFPQQKTAVVESIEIEEEWSLDDLDVEPGQAIDVLAGQILQRRIEISASGTLAINIPELNILAPEGISLHIKEPQLRDRSNRGVQVASLVQNIDYVVVEDGRYHLGGERYSWWSSELSELQYKDFQMISIATKGSLKQRSILMLLGGTVILILVIFVLWSLRRFSQRRNISDKYPVFNVQDYRN